MTDPGAAAVPRTLRAPGVGAFVVDPVRGITVERAPGADEAEVEALLHGSASAVLLQQRRRLPLHVAAVAIGSRAVALAGSAGIGKSSVACALTERGHRLVTDDLAAVSYDERGRPLLEPGPPMMRIWGGSARRLGWPTDEEHRIKPGVDKFRYPMPERFVDGPRRLAALYVLAEQPVPEVSIRPVTGFEKFQVLHSGATYNPEYLDTPALRTWHFGEVCRVAAEVRVHLLARPAGDWDLGEVAARVERHVSRGGPA